MIAWRAEGARPIEIHSRLAAQRRKRGAIAPSLTGVRKFLNGKTHRRAAFEARGRKPVLRRSHVAHMNRVRIQKVQRGDGAVCVRWDDIIGSGKTPTVHRTTAARAFQREGIDVKFRRSREKPQRSPEHEAERKELAGRMRRWPIARFTDGIDMIIDNKVFEAPLTKKTREYHQKQQVVGQLRTRSEGLMKGFTKPNVKRHRRFFGQTLHVCAGVSNSKVVLWEYIQGRWNGDRAADMYKGPIMKALRKHKGVKPSYLIAEDNDPTGYKSGKGRQAKMELGIRTVEWPRYSPDLNPLDFSLWTHITNRMKASAPKGSEALVAFKKRLRRTALSTPTAAVRRMVESMRRRAQLIYEADGGDIRCD